MFLSCFSSFWQLFGMMHLEVTLTFFQFGKVTIITKSVMHTFTSVLTHKHFIVCSSTVNQTGTPLETSYLVAAIRLTEIGQLQFF